MGLDTVLDLLFPASCPFCGTLTGKAVLCDCCAPRLPLAEGTVGRREGAGYGVCVFPLFYEDAVRDSILQFKFGGKAPWAAVYAGLLVDCVAERLSGEFDCLTWVPVSRKRLHHRGYDQARLLAEAAGKQWSTRPLSLLKKTRDTPPQSLQGDIYARRANVLGVYAASEDAAHRRILLIDDIFTTGSTLAECTRVLREAGAASVVCATLAAGREMEHKPVAQNER